MPPEPRHIPRFAAEPPQEGLPYGRWAETLAAEFLAAALAVGDDVGEPGELVWFPDRTYAGRTYVPVTALTSTGLELFGYVSFATGAEPTDFVAIADVTEETAEQHPEWKVDLCDEVIGRWRGPEGSAAQITLVWGVPLLDGGAVATADLGGRVTVAVVDQCPLLENRFTLIGPDDYRGDTLSVRIWDGRGTELAHESLYDD
jgi:hypothetical protein